MLAALSLFSATAVAGAHRVLQGTKGATSRTRAVGPAASRAHEPCASTDDGCGEPRTCAARVAPGCYPPEPVCMAADGDCDDPVVEEPGPAEPVEYPAPDEYQDRQGTWRRVGPRGPPVASLRGSMARTWHELFETGEEARSPAAPEDGEGERRGFFKRLRDNMSKTRQAIGAELQTTVFQSLDDEAFERLEETLIYADVGAPTTAKIVERLETEAESGDLEGGEGLSRRLRELLAETARVDGDTIPLTEHPTVILMTGVNGSGKTTTIGKMAWHLQKELGRSVLLAAGDTFRAAAGEQLALWAERSGADFVRGEAGSDPGAVVYDAIEAALARGHDVVIVDTAGRLHTQQHLMDELRKVRKVIERQAPGAPHETLLTIDATTGQNGLRQALLFREAVDVTGIVLTKLDGTAKGGIALAIAQELGVPVKLIGIGEALEDLRPFDPDDFAQAILEP
ncbi:MAG TPA: signal recognition particle-docking protein FtsY [Thermoleophilaceae bacterium]|nr:signal recognition particle-docking protein FtsY [Thermoleophilaceae bacterium]